MTEAVSLAEVARLRREGRSVTQIAKTIGCRRSVVDRAIRNCLLVGLLDQNDEVARVSAFRLNGTREMRRRRTLALTTSL